MYLNENGNKKENENFSGLPPKSDVDAAIPNGQLSSDANK